MAQSSLFARIGILGNSADKLCQKWLPIFTAYTRALLRLKWEIFQALSLFGEYFWTAFRKTERPLSRQKLQLPQYE